MGDSISAAYGMSLDDGWVALLQERINKLGLSYQVVNASISGDVSSSGASRIAKLLNKFQPEWTLIELGGNDGLRGMPLKHIKGNLESMIKDGEAAGTQVVLVGMEIFPNYGPKYTAAFKDIYHDLAKTHKLPFVPFILKGVGGLPHMNQADGVHPTKAAQRLLLDNVWTTLGPLLSQ